MLRKNPWNEAFMWPILSRIQSLTCCMGILRSTPSQERGAHPCFYMFCSTTTFTVPSTICIYASIRSERVASWRCSSWKPHISEKKTWQCTDICHLAFTLLILFMFLKATVVKHSNLYTDYHYSLLERSICPFFFWNTFTTDVTLVFDNKQRGGDLG